MLALCAVVVACGGGVSGSADPPIAAGPTPEPTVSLDMGRVAAVDGGSPLADGWQGGAFMQVFVRSYQDSDGDGHGDLRGLVQRLDYLRDLGIKGLWLMPVQPSQDGDHGYAVTDYRAIDPRYGTLADFDTLLREAHARGIGVVIDYVINHSAAHNPLFVNARAGASTSYRDWYLWQPTRPTGWSVFGGDPWRSNPAGGWYFAAFWDQMPDFNLRNPAVLGWHHDNLRFWLNRGVDGFRFDAVGNLVENGPAAWADQPDNLAILRDARAMMDGYARRYLVCEGPGAPTAYNGACGSAFAFGLHSRILDAARGNAGAVASVAGHFNDSAHQGMATLLANHDGFAGERVFDQLAGNLAQYRLAAATYLLLPGTPFIYYGEEIGLAGAATLSGDARLRTPMSWTGDARNAGFSTGSPYRALSANLATANVAAQAADPDSLLSFYKAMLALRNGLPAIARGQYEAARAEGPVFSFQRRLGSDRALVVINYGSGPAGITLASLGAGTHWSSRHPAGGTDLAVGASGQASLAIAPQSARVFSLR
jgi:alpha-amylase